MPRILPALPCTPEQHDMLMCLARGQKVQARLKERARIVLRGIDRVGIQDTAKEMGLDKDTVSPMAMSLYDSWRGGSAGPATLGRAAQAWPRTARTHPGPTGGGATTREFGHWDGALASEHVGSARVAGLGHFAH